MVIIIVPLRGNERFQSKKSGFYRTKSNKGGFKRKEINTANTLLIVLDLHLIN